MITSHPSTRRKANSSMGEKGKTVVAQVNISMRNDCGAMTGNLLTDCGGAAFHQDLP